MGWEVSDLGVGQTEVTTVVGRRGDHRARADTGRAERRSARSRGQKGARETGDTGMTTPEAEPCYGQIWKKRTNGKEVFVEIVSHDAVRYCYSSSSRSYHCTRERFPVRFKFSHVFV